MNKYAFRRGLTAVVLLLSMFMVAGAQEFRGSISGNITDPNGATLPGATVEIKNVETNVTATATTNDEGGYTFPLLPPGKYMLTVTSDGFNTTQRQGITLGVADKLTLDVQLEVGITGTVVVVDSAVALETGSVSTGSVIDSRQIRELPLIDGSPYQLATLTPGIAYTGNPAFTGPTSNGNLAAFRSNGATGPNQVTLDGAPNFAIDGGVGFSPPSEAVQEFKVQTNAFDAGQGYSAGANVNVAIKSGTNAPHGSLYYFNRDRSRTTNNFFSNSSGQQRPPRTYHRYGGTLNGPVYLPNLYDGRNRTFFLFSYEGLKNEEAEPQLYTVPTEKMRRGDFSDFIAPGLSATQRVVIYDPATAQATGTVTRTPFAGNIIPTDRLDPVAVAYLNLYPLPNTTGRPDGTNNFFSPTNRSIDYRGWVTRLDHNINDNQRISGNYYHSFNPEDRRDWTQAVVNGFPLTKGFEFRTNDGATINYTATLSPTTVVDVRTSLSRFVQERRPAGSFDPAQLGFTPQALAAMRGYTYLPRFDIRTYDQTRPIRSTLGAERSDYNEGLIRPFYVFSFQPTVTRIFKNHTARFGYDARVLRENFSSNGYRGGRFFFDGTFTTVTTATTTNSNNAANAERNRNVYGRDVAAFLLGLPSASTSQSRIENSVNYNVQSLYHGFFAQDDWRITPKLTLNFGLRYELELGLTERFNRIINGFDLTTPSPVEAAARAAYTSIFNANPSLFQVTPDQFRVVGGFAFANEGNRSAWEADRTNWQPRIGLAYQLDEKTVLRGGFGIFMAPFRVETPIQPGFSGFTPFVPTNNNGRTFVATLDDPFPNGLVQSPGASLGLLTEIGQDIGTAEAPIIPDERQNAKFSRLVIGIQRELPGQIVVEANFVSAWGRDLGVNRNLNFVPRQFLGDTPETDTAANDFLSFDVSNPFRNLLPGTGSPLHTATTVDRAVLLRPFTQFGNLFVQEYNGTNRYNAIQLQGQKRLSQSLSLSTSYTYSRLKEKVNYLNPSDTELEERFSPDDRPHRFTLAAVYELPLGQGRAFGKEMNGVLNAFLGGWQLNGTYEWQSGEPFLLNNPLYFAGDISQLSSRVGQYDEQGRKYGVDIPAFDTTGIVRLSGFGLRNVPTTLPKLRNQPFKSINLSTAKSFNFGEGKQLQFRAEVLNAFNYAYFGGINLDPSNAAFGFVSNQRNLPRDVQLGAKFTF